jgi:hypothetical protein
MTMQNPLFQGTFPAAVDPPLPPISVIDQNLLARFDAQIRALQQYVLPGAAYLGPISGNTNLTAAQIASPVLIFTGSPSGAFELVFPTTENVPLPRVVLNLTPQIASVAASTGGATVDLASGLLALVLFDGSDFNITATGGGGGGGGGPTLLSTIYATPGSPLSRAAAWMRAGIDTVTAAVEVTMDSAAVVGDQFDALDAGRSWGVTGKAFTFNGNGYLVEDPFRQVALAATWVSPAGFSDVGASWVLLADTNISGGKFWKAL